MLCKNWMPALETMGVALLEEAKQVWQLRKTGINDEIN